VARTPAPLQEAHKTIRDGRERRHISVFGKDFTVLPLKRIIVGPSGSQDRWRKRRGLQIGNTLYWLRLRWPLLANDLYQIGEPVLQRENLPLAPMDALTSV
jgi:hypothetical protein